MGLGAFAGPRLTEVRQARGYTQTALAKELGMTNTAISQYEAGRRVPSRDVLSRIAETLNVPIHFFMVQACREKEGSPVFYRSMSAATKSARKRAEQHYNWLRDIIALLRKSYIEFAPLRFPSYETPSDPLRIDEDDIEEVAKQTREFWGVREGPISDVVGVIERNGGIVVRRDLGARTLDAFSKWSQSEGCPYFVLNGQKSCSVRSRFDAGHELGHILLHRNITADTFADTSMFKHIEGQAHYFAGAFLLPESEFLDDFPIRINLDALLAIKSKWRVSLAAIIKRLRSLKCISAKKERMLFTELSRRNWRSHEPLDDEIEVEEPSVIRKALDLLADAKIDSINLFYTKLGLSVQDVENATGLTGYFTGGRDDEPFLRLVS